MKGKVFEQLSIPVQYQRMVFAGKELENDRVLSDYNIQRESTLHCAVRPVPESPEHARAYAKSVLSAI